MSIIEVTGANVLLFSGKRYRCAVGLNGFTTEPHEGAKKTPVGTFALRECWYRTDRLARPVTGLPLRGIRRDDGWCDDPAHPDYNRHVKLPFSASHEKLWRGDHTYDIIVPIGFNDTEIIPGKGSAIFFHLAKPGYSPTLGCVAVALPDMLAILGKLDSQSEIVITNQAHGYSFTHFHPDE